MNRKSLTLLAAVAMPCRRQPAFAQGSYKKELPEALAKKTKVTEEVSRQGRHGSRAQGRDPGRRARGREGQAHLLVRHQGPRQVRHRRSQRQRHHGQVIAFSHETPADEKKEAAADAKAAAKKKKP